MLTTQSHYPNTGTGPLFTQGHALVLAPMEGVADYWLRQVLTQVGGYDWCVTEFVRVSGRLLPPSVFYRWCPELKHGAKTLSGTPVHVQDRKSTRLNSSHVSTSYAVFCSKKKHA